MAAGVLGRSLGKHLRTLQGRHYVQLPLALRGEAEALVEACNDGSSEPWKALLVVARRPAGAPEWMIEAGDLLAWRTDDDRAFVILDGAVEPDSSFASATSAFLTDSFPASGGGLCDPAWFAERGVREAMSGSCAAAADAFADCAPWAFQLLSMDMRGEGLRAGRWSGRLLSAWSDVLSDLEDAVRAAEAPPMEIRPAHAWELVRLCGFPRPSRGSFSGTSASEAPPPAEEVGEGDLSRVAKMWSEFVDRHVSQGDVGVVLEELRATARMAGQLRWAGLDWAEARRRASNFEESASSIGRRLFEFPRFLDAADEAADRWRAVDAGELQDAMAAVHGRPPALSSPAGGHLLRVGNGTFLLDTRATTVSRTTSGVTAKARLEGLLLDVAIPLRTPSLDEDGLAEGGVLVLPDIAVKAVPKTGLDIEVASASVEAGAIRIELSARASSGTKEGRELRWKVERKLVVEMTVRDYLGGELQAPRTLALSSTLIAPSPYWPTAVLVDDGGGRLAVAPPADTVFKVDAGCSLPDTTPDLEAPDQRYATLFVYDGRWDVFAGRYSEGWTFLYEGSELPAPGPRFAGEARVRLADEAALRMERPDGQQDVAIIRVADASQLPTNPLRRRKRGAALQGPSEASRSAPLGRYQGHVAGTLSRRARGLGAERAEDDRAGPSDASAPEALAAEGSLFQLVLPSGSGEVPAEMSFGRLPVATGLVAGGIPGVGAGPSEALAGTAAWGSFVALAHEVAAAVLSSGISDWLSSAEATRASASLVRRYLAAHRDLIEAAADPADAFWATYPFSVFIVNANRGPELRTLEAIFLSPLHPARFGWLYSAQSHLDALGHSSSLLGLLDAWNVPAMGEAPVAGAGVPMRLVSLPLDPGPDGDYAPWSALVATTPNGVVKSPSFAAGARLPWGGRSGLGERVVDEALTDYAAAHPFLTSLVVELRSALEAPRSTEVDRAVLSWLVRKLPELGGAAKVLDSVKRIGAAPTRDDFYALQGDLAPGSFTWIVPSPDEGPAAAVDVAFVEHAAPFTQHVEGGGHASAPALPMRRFPGILDRVAYVDYDYRSESDDVLGLNALLSRMEPAGKAMRVVATPEALQAEAGVRWEVVGDINLEPAQMARLAASTTIGKLLWEWRPGWINAGREPAAAARGAHYVLAKVPGSLIAGLARNMRFGMERALELVGELGARGVGIATLRQHGSTQEAEAAGLFFAARILTGFKACTMPPRWLPPGCLIGLLPLDPLQAILEGLAAVPDAAVGQAGGRRADLLVVVADVGEGRPSRLKVTAVESKQRTGGSRNVPDAAESAAAAGQAIASTRLLQAFGADVANEEGGAPFLLRLSAKLQAFAGLVDLALKFNVDPVGPPLASRLVQDILGGTFSLEVGAGLVIWTCPASRGGHADEPGEARVIPVGGVAEVVLDPDAANSLLWAGAEGGAKQLRFRGDLDGFLASILLPSAGAPLATGGRDLKATLAAALGLEEPAPLYRDGEGGELREGGSGVGPFNGKPAGAGAESAGPASGAPSDDAPFVEGFGPRAPAPADGAAPGWAGPSGGGFAVSGAGGAAAPPDPSPEASDAPASPPIYVDAFVGAETSGRFAVIGRTASQDKVVALDLDQPKAVGVFGYMGSGKSYLLGALIEGAVLPIPGINSLVAPLAVVVFNYRRNAADRFELSSLVHANDEPEDVARLAGYGAVPAALPDLRVLCLPGERAGRQAEYLGATTSELYFDPAALDVEDWELLMGEPGSEAVFARTIRSGLQELRRGGTGISVAGVRDYLTARLPRGSMAAAELRLEAVERIVSMSAGVDFGALLKPGRVLTIDLRQPMFNRDEAMKVILVCANQIAKQKVAFNKLVVFDEAHEYMTESFGDRFDGRIRYMRHEGTSYVFATQDVRSIPVEVRRHLGTQFVFSLETRDNIADMARAAPEFAGLNLQHMEAGSCYVASSKSTGNLFRVPRLLKVRPRVTRHGGKSRILDGGPQD